MITILSVFPELLDLNGDAQNALVLAQRARWAGWDARVHNLALGDSLEGAEGVPDQAVPVVAFGVRGEDRGGGKRGGVGT